MNELVTNSGDWVENLTAILIDKDNNITIKEFHAL